MTKKKLTVKDASLLLEQWMPRFGFGHYKIRVDVIGEAGRGKFWARCSWNHEEEVARFEFVPDGVLELPQLESTVVHELAHGLVSLLDIGGEVEETVCNRIVRLVMGKKHKLVNEHMLHAAEWDYNLSVDPALGELLPVLIDALPDDEREAINRSYYERLSLREIAQDLGLKHPEDVRRLLRRAQRRLRGWLEKLDEEGSECLHD